MMIAALVMPRTTAVAQTGHTQVRKSSEVSWTNEECSQGVELRLSSIEPSQGSLQMVELNSTTRLAEVTGRWDENEISFWHRDATASSDVDMWRAYLGIDLEHANGPSNFVISAKTSDGQSISCSPVLTVKAGQFAVERLKVAPQYVEPNPEQLARAQAEREQLRQIFATVTPEKLWNGKFRIPLQGVTTGGNFGKRRVLNGEPSSPHSGVDFPAPTGTPIHSAQNGRVILAEPLYFSGNTVIVDHGLGVYTLYGHLSEFNVKAGDSVETGDVLGKVGATGRVTGPHLHWGLTVNRARVNSLDIVKLPD